MTHNTKKLEEIVETLLEELSYGGRKNYLDDTMGMDTAREILRTTLHHQLQKAREEERERCFQKICLVRGSIRDKALFEATEVFVTALDHSELDQDNK